MNICDHYLYYYASGFRFNCIGRFFEIHKSRLQVQDSLRSNIHMLRTPVFLREIAISIHYSLNWQQIRVFFKSNASTPNTMKEK